jgi:hypothetical protein
MVKSSSFFFVNAKGLFLFIIVNKMQTKQKILNCLNYYKLKAFLFFFIYKLKTKKFDCLIFVCFTAIEF